MSSGSIASHGLDDKLAAREHLRKRVGERLNELLDAQIANALGVSYPVTIDKTTGKFIRVGPAMASRQNEKTIQVWEKDPSVRAFIDLLNRAIGKPAEQPTELDLRMEEAAGAALNRIKERNRRLQLAKAAGELYAGSTGNGTGSVS
jgi:hypothetical protein